MINMQTLIYRHICVIYVVIVFIKLNDCIIVGQQLNSPTLAYVQSAKLRCHKTESFKLKNRCIFEIYFIFIAYATAITIIYHCVIYFKTIYICVKLCIRICENKLRLKHDIQIFVIN